MQDNLNGASTGDQLKDLAEDQAKVAAQADRVTNTVSDKMGTGAGGISGVSTGRPRF
jgi:hypothetical protein